MAATPLRLLGIERTAAAAAAAGGGGGSSSAPESPRAAPRTACWTSAAPAARGSTGEHRFAQQLTQQRRRMSACAELPAPLQRCAVCGGAVGAEDARVLTEEGGVLHARCFVCSACGKPLQPQAYGTDLNGRYFCAAHLSSSRPTSLEYRALFMGWMAKQGGFVRNWRRRFFVLLDGELRYYAARPAPADGSDAAPKGVIPLRDVLSVSSSFLFVPASKDFPGGSLPALQLVRNPSLSLLVHKTPPPHHHPLIRSQRDACGTLCARTRPSASSGWTPSSRLLR